MTQIGHNKKTRVGGVAVDQLRSIIDRVEKLEEEKSALGADIRDVFAEARGSGFCPKAIRVILRERKLDASERDERDHLIETYKRSLGMLPQLDMFEAGEGDE